MIEVEGIGELREQDWWRSRRLVRRWVRVVTAGWPGSKVGETMEADERAGVGICLANVDGGLSALDVVSAPRAGRWDRAGLRGQVR